MTGVRSLTDLLIDESSDALIAVAVDGRTLSWNGGAERLFGYTASEAIGRSVIELLIPEEQSPRAVAPFDLGAVSNRRSAPYESVHRRKDGSAVHVQVNLRRIEAPGEEPFIALAVRDIGKLRRLREAQALEARFRGLLEAAPDAMVIADAAGRIQLVNGQVETLFGYRRQELLGRPIEILIPAEARDRHAAHRAGYGKDPRRRPMGAGLSLRGLRKDGSEFPAEISLAPMPTAEGFLITAAIRDTTDRQRLEQAMRDASRSKSEFLASMSHELRTPLNAIIGFADLMHRGKVGPVSVEHEEYLGDILTSAKHLLQLINDVLDLAKVESGKMQFRPERVDLGRLVGEVEDVLQGLASSKHMRIEAQVSPGLGPVFVDPARIKQVLFNYASNALKFTLDGGQVTIRVAEDGPDRFRIDVEDTGIGIAHQDLGRLFVEFHQLGGGSSKRIQGTGLGLALTKKIVEAHGGSVEVASTLGKGSTFSAILPRVMVGETAGEEEGLAPRLVGPEARVEEKPIAR